MIQSRRIRDILVRIEFILPFTQNWTDLGKNLPGLVMSPEILNPEFEVGTLNPKTFESRES